MRPKPRLTDSKPQNRKTSLEITFQLQEPTSLPYYSMLQYTVFIQFAQAL